MIEAPHDIPEGFKPQASIELSHITVSDQKHPPDRQHRDQFVHQPGPDTPTLVVGVNGDIIDGRVIFPVAERAGSPDQPLTIEGEAYGRAVLKGPLHLVSLPAAQLRGLEQGDQLLAINASDVELEPHCRRICPHLPAYYALLQTEGVWYQIQDRDIPPWTMDVHVQYAFGGDSYTGLQGLYSQSRNALRFPHAAHTRR